MGTRTEHILHRGKFRGITGSAALVLAIVAKAVVDAGAGCPEARAYFALPEYRAHLFWLGLDIDLLPAAFENDGKI